MSLYQRTTYTNPDIEFLVNTEIVEYDMRRAGISLIKKYNLLPEGEIEKLDLLDKDEQNVAIGKLQGKDREFTKRFTQSFRDARQLFFEANGLNDENILSIKRDAIFTTKECLITDFDELVFVDKNRYTSYYLFSRYEFYYFGDGIDVKGISDLKLEQHSEYFLMALYNFMRFMENAKPKTTIEYIKDFTELYKTKNLSIEFYRELNKDSLFRLFRKFNGSTMGVEHMDDKNLIDIQYNFKTYILPLISIALNK